MATYITTAGYKALKDEFEHLKSVERPKVVNEVAEAAAQGDRSENAEYIYGKRRLREIDSRMRFLNKSFADMQVIDPSTPRGDKVFFGATVTLYDEDNDRESLIKSSAPSTRSTTPTSAISLPSDRLCSENPSTPAFPSKPLRKPGT